MPEDRLYFAPPYHLWHGRASRRDSDIPLIVAHPGKSREKIEHTVDAVSQGRHQQRLITDLLLHLRRGR